MHYCYDIVGIGVICRNRVSRYERLRGIQRGVPRDQASVSEMRARPQTNNRATLGLCLSWRLRLCRKLKHRCLLTLPQPNASVHA